MIARAYGDAGVLLVLGGAGAGASAGAGACAGAGTDDAEGAVGVRVARALGARFPSADIVVGAGSVAVFGVESSRERCAEVLAIGSAALGSGEAAPPSTAREHVIEVCYDGPDLDSVASSAGMSVDQVVCAHAGGIYRVSVVGFLPGFAYLTGLERALHLPRRPAPRTSVAAGSVAIAGPYSGIYPFASPGGWHLLGRARDARLFDPRREPATRFAIGDRVRFAPIDAFASPPPSPREEETRPAGACLVIQRVPPAASIQDEGRPGRLGEGLPPSGPLDFDAHRAANLAVGNPEGAAAIELPLGTARVTFDASGVASNGHGSAAKRRALVSIDGESPIALDHGADLEIAASERCVRYLAVRGGIDVPPVLGARATLALVGLGGHQGRWLAKGDRLPIGREPQREGERVIAEPGGALEALGPSEPALVPVVLGPGEDAFDDDARAALLGSTFIVSHQMSRVGTRLDGPKVPRRGADDGRPEPMVRGAIQITTDGTPIVLGPDHAVTGGYPVIAVVRRAALVALARQRPGRAIRFVVDTR